MPGGENAHSPKTLLFLLLLKLLRTTLGTDHGSTAREKGGDGHGHGTEGGPVGHTGGTLTARPPPPHPRWRRTQWKPGAQTTFGSMSLWEVARGIVL